MAERLYSEQPFLVSFDAKVTAVREVSRHQGQALWQLALDRTAFYPAGGGQPHDLGSLIAIAPSGACLNAPVLAVEEDEAGEIWHSTAKPLLDGTEVRGEIDFARRFDHMQQHTGQHLLSAVFLRCMNAPTASFHLGGESSTIDLTLAALAPEELARVEEEANRAIAEDRSVIMRTVSGQDARLMLAAGELRKLPDREGSIRLIEIAGLDLNACGGTHLDSTGKIGGLLIRDVARVKQGLRVEFLCGLRAVRSARVDRGALRRAAAALSLGPEQLPEAVERLQRENKGLAKDRQKLREDLAGYHAASLAAEVSRQSPPWIVRRIFPDRDAEYVRMLASKITGSGSRACALLASTMEEPARVVAAVSDGLKFDCGALLREALSARNGRGGGGPAMAQGQIARAQVDEMLSALEGRLRGAAAS